MALSRGIGPRPPTSCCGKVSSDWRRDWKVAQRSRQLPSLPTKPGYMTSRACPSFGSSSQSDPLPAPGSSSDPSLSQSVQSPEGPMAVVVVVVVVLNEQSKICGNLAATVASVRSRARRLAVSCGSTLQRLQPVQLQRQSAITCFAHLGRAWSSSLRTAQPYARRLIPGFTGRRRPGRTANTTVSRVRRTIPALAGHGKRMAKLASAWISDVAKAASQPGARQPARERAPLQLGAVQLLRAESECCHTHDLEVPPGFTHRATFSLSPFSP
ncbi:uncharacterized protein PAN0_073d6603 [Moesziomyces antarcticus]|uniref:Uncharacterized protein n=1 Tax=Pseudozyma antarctica TaxID=84753 RepID=A0A081CNW1_PSEA2|nr:uncharacterized protein PAN0_073d6603 [Moesziomyces antarcticus]GAK68357.1 hypothetical protein PAN0_073d6603 [Moesziomyces antarcticus]